MDGEGVVGVAEGGGGQDAWGGEGGGDGGCGGGMARRDAERAWGGWGGSGAVGEVSDGGGGGRICVAESSAIGVACRRWMNVAAAVAGGVGCQRPGSGGSS